MNSLGEVINFIQERLLRKFFMVITVLALLNCFVSAGTEIIAHQGASGDAPENTLGAIELAWKQGADGVKINVRLTKDNVIVVFHDPDTKRIGKTDKEVKNQTYAELLLLDVGKWKGKKWKGERIPRLQDVINAIPDNKKIIVEVNPGSDKIISLIRKVLERTYAKPEMIAFESPNYKFCAKLKKTFPKYRVYLSLGGHPTFRANPKAIIKKLKAANLNGVDINYTVVNKLLVDGLHKQNMKVIAHTVNDPWLMRLLKDVGTHAIVTDHPGLMKKYP